MIFQKGTIVKKVTIVKTFLPNNSFISIALLPVFFSNFIGFRFFHKEPSLVCPENMHYKVR